MSGEKFFFLSFNLKMFCSLSFNKNVLVGINISYIAVAFLLIGVAAHGKSSNQITSLPIIGGIIAPVLLNDPCFTHHML